VQQMMVIEQRRQAIAQELNRQPTNSELATNTGKTETEIAQFLKLGQRAK
jgi:DNA-directed RNA polymerase specialized sigma subunit